MSERGATAVGAYVRAVERWWSDLWDRPLILSPREWTLVEGWHRRGIPLQLVREAIETAAERLRRPGAAPPKSLSYLAPAIEESWRVVREGRCASPPDAAVTAPPSAGGIAAWRSAASKAGAEMPLGRLLTTILARLDAGASQEEAERALDENLLDAAPAELRELVRAELEAELGPYRQRMSDDEYASTLRKASVRRLRMALTLPALDGEGPESDSPK